MVFSSFLQDEANCQEVPSILRVGMAGFECYGTWMPGFANLILGACRLSGFSFDVYVEPGIGFKKKEKRKTNDEIFMYL
jgi:hypothetical protein